MKSVKIASLLLASGMLLGSVHSAVTPAYTAHAQTESAQRDVSNQVTLEDDDVFVNDEGIITAPTLNDIPKLVKLFDGGELVIPAKLRGKTIRGVGSFAFNKNYANMVPGINNISGIAKLTFKTPGNINYIGEGAFTGNAISGRLYLPNADWIDNGAFGQNKLTEVDLPEVTYIGEAAFSRNNIKTINLPNVEDVYASAFNGNELTEVTLPKVLEISEAAFANNAIRKIELSGRVEFSTGHVAPYIGAFAGQKLDLAKTADGQGAVPLSELLPSLKIGGEEQLEISNVKETNESGKVTIDNEKITVKDKNQSLTVGLGMDIDSEYSRGGYSLASMQLKIDPMPSIGGGGNNTGDSNTSTTPDTTPETNTPDTNLPGTGNNESPIAISPDPDVNRPHTVYAKRAMRLHSNVSLTNPTKSYKKQSRAKAASFRIQGVSYDNNGKKRYKVKGGYITASTKYVADSHFRSSKVKQVRVIGNKVNSYKNAKLSKSQQVRSYKKGTKLKVKRIVKQGRTTRFQLNNGRYITGNKQLLIMDHSK